MAIKPTGVRIIVGYKIAKAILQVTAAIMLFYGATHGLAAALAKFAEELREHAVHAWSNVLAAALLRFTKGRHSLWLAAYALLGDAILSGVEAWALWRGYAWGSWLIVGATTCLLPFEIHAMALHIRVGRVILFLVNLAIVAYLLRRVEAERLFARAVLEAQAFEARAREAEAREAESRDAESVDAPREGQSDANKRP